MNESAFPRKWKNKSDTVYGTHYDPGLTKLEYASIEAMKGILAGPPQGVDYGKESVSKYSIGYAKELLKQLEGVK